MLKLKKQIALSIVIISLVVALNIINSKQANKQLDSMFNLKNPELSKHLQNQLKVGNKITNNLMYFHELPNTSVEVTDSINSIQEKTKEFGEAGLKATIVFDRSESKLDINSLEYLSYIRAIFEGLKNNKDFDPANIDTIIYLPEANLPELLSVEPGQYNKSINDFFGISRQYFPSMNNSLLLETTTYSKDDINYSNGKRNSLEPYLKDLNKSLINRLYIQGFPYAFPFQAQGNKLLSADNYYELGLLEESYEYLGFKDIYLNTGILISTFHNSNKETLYLPKTEIEKQINTSLTFYKKLQDKGYKVHLNIFAEDKSNSGEGRNWNLQHYDSVMFLSYIEKLQKININFSIFDI
jgi:hypothetical protein